MNRVPLLLVLALVGPLACISIELPPLGRGALVEEVVFGEGDAKILLLDLEGTISEQAQAGTFGLGGRESMVSRVREQLEKAADDTKIKALLLRINSPGGTASASEMIYGEIQRFKREREIPVVAQLMGVAASGGYYLAMAADEVRAYPTTITGSIGVIFAGLNLSGLFDKVGITNQTLKTGAYKDAGSPFRAMLPDERAQLESVLQDLFERFFVVVEAGRPALDRETLKSLADGRIYSATQAKTNGLVDALGDLPAAVEAAQARAGLEKASVIVYHRNNEMRENLFSVSAPQEPPLTAGSWLAQLPGPAFLYWWSPGGLAVPVQ